DVFAFDGVADPVDPDGAKVDGEAVGIMDCRELRTRTFWNEDVAVATEDVFADRGAIHVRGVCILDICVDGFVGSYGDFGSAGNRMPLRDRDGWSEKCEQEREWKMFHGEPRFGV